MGKHKLARFAENATFSNLFQHTEYDFRNGDFPMRGKWNELYFKNENPITLELGCGKGEYTLALAQRFPDRNFIGVDKKGARLWRGCKDATIQKMTNVAFLRTAIDDIAYFFAPEEVKELWITFPDPQPVKERKRLVSPFFIDKYRHILSADNIIHLKTDSRLLYDYMQDVIKSEQWQLLDDIEHVYDQDYNTLLTEIQTFYEKKWLKEGSKISYVEFKV